MKSGTSNNSILSNSSLQNHSSRQEKSLLTIFCFISCTFFVCHLPRAVLNIYEFELHRKTEVCLRDYNATFVPPAWMFVTISIEKVLLIFNASANFIYYCFSGREFRNRFIRIVSCGRGRALVGGSGRSCVGGGGHTDMDTEQNVRGGGLVGGVSGVGGVNGGGGLLLDCVVENCAGGHGGKVVSVETVVLTLSTSEQGEINSLVLEHRRKKLGGKAKRKAKAPFSIHPEIDDDSELVVDSEALTEELKLSGERLDPTLYLAKVMKDSTGNLML